MAGEEHPPDAWPRHPADASRKIPVFPALRRDDEYLGLASSPPGERRAASALNRATWTVCHTGYTTGQPKPETLPDRRPNRRPWYGERAGKSSISLRATRREPTCRPVRIRSPRGTVDMPSIRCARSPPAPATRPAPLSSEAPWRMPQEDGSSSRSAPPTREVPPGTPAPRRAARAPSSPFSGKTVRPRRRNGPAASRDSPTAARPPTAAPPPPAPAPSRCPGPAPRGPRRARRCGSRRRREAPAAAASAPPRRPPARS